MPFAFRDARKAFKLELDGETPTVAVEQIGDGWWVAVCPLCGCGHEVFKPVVRGARVWHPTCVAGSLVHVYAPVRATWLKAHAECIGYESIRFADGVLRDWRAAPRCKVSKREKVRA